MMQTTRQSRLESFQSPEANRGKGASTSIAPNLCLWLEQAAIQAAAAQARGYMVSLILTASPPGINVIARKSRDGTMAEAIKTVGLDAIVATTGKALLLAIEETIAQIEAYLFSQDYLPSIQARQKATVENACKFFYENLDIAIKQPNVKRNWSDFVESKPDEAAAIRRAIQASMEGSRAKA